MTIWGGKGLDYHIVAQKPHHRTLNSSIRVLKKHNCSTTKHVGCVMGDSKYIDTNSFGRALHIFDKLAQSKISLRHQKQLERIKTEENWRTQELQRNWHIDCMYSKKRVFTRRVHSVHDVSRCTCSLTDTYKKIAPSLVLIVTTF